MIATHPRPADRPGMTDDALEACVTERAVLRNQLEVGDSS